MYPIRPSSASSLNELQNAPVAFMLDGIFEIAGCFGFDHQYALSMSIGESLGMHRCSFLLHSGSVERRLLSPYEKTNAAKTGWVDPDDTPELTRGELDHPEGKWRIEGREISPEEGEAATCAMCLPWLGQRTKTL